MESRQKAMNWWNNLSSIKKASICDNNKELLHGDRQWQSLTGREIQMVYEKDYQVFAMFAKLEGAQYYTFITPLSIDQIDMVDEMQSQIGTTKIYVASAIKSFPTQHPSELEWSNSSINDKLVLHRDVDKFPIFRLENY